MNTVTSKIRVNSTDEDFIEMTMKAVRSYVTKMTHGIVHLAMDGNVIVVVYRFVRQIGIDIFGHVIDSHFVSSRQRNLFSLVSI